jgi:predicted ATPase
MKKKKIKVTDERMRQRGEECSTFSNEYWCSMTPAQQRELIEIRERKVSSAAYRVAENEESAEIRDKMEEWRSLNSPNN